MKYYTIGQIHKFGLLKTFNGEPYKDKASVSKIVNTMKWKRTLTKNGYAKVVSEKDIKERNANMKEHGWGWATVEALRTANYGKPLLSKKETTELQAKL